MLKIITWISVNGASILGIIQAVIKMLKEVITAVINFISLIMPSSKAQEFVLKARELVEKIDAFIEQYKGILVK